MFQNKEYEEMNQAGSYLLDVRHVSRVSVIGTIFIFHLHSNDGSPMLVLGGDAESEDGLVVGTILSKFVIFLPIISNMPYLKTRVSKDLRVISSRHWSRR
jgi:hypothetical protein